MNTLNIAPIRSNIAPSVVNRVATYSSPASDIIVLEKTTNTLLPLK